MFGALQDYIDKSGDSSLQEPLDSIKSMEDPVEQSRELAQLMSYMIASLTDYSATLFLHGKSANEFKEKSKLSSILEDVVSKDDTAKYELRELSQFRIKTLEDISHLVPLSTFRSMNRFGEKVAEVIETKLQEAGLGFAEELEPSEEHRVFALYKATDDNKHNRLALGICNFLKMKSLHQLAYVSEEHFRSASQAYLSRSYLQIRGSISSVSVDLILDSIMRYMNLLNIEFKPEIEQSDEFEA